MTEDKWEELFWDFLIGVEDSFKNDCSVETQLVKVGIAIGRARERVNKLGKEPELLNEETQANSHCWSDSSGHYLGGDKKLYDRLHKK